MNAPATSLSPRFVKTIHFTDKEIQTSKDLHYCETRGGYYSEYQETDSECCDLDGNCQMTFREYKTAKSGSASGPRCSFKVAASALALVGMIFAWGTLIYHTRT